MSGMLELKLTSTMPLSLGKSWQDHDQISGDISTDYADISLKISTMFDYNHNRPKLVKLAGPMVRLGWPRHISNYFIKFDCYGILNVSVLLLYQPRYNYIPHRFRAFLGSKGIFLLSSTLTRLLTRFGLIHMLGAIALLNFVYDGFLAHPWHEKLE